MWPRKQLDIGWSDLCFGLWQIVTAHGRAETQAVVGTEWLPPEEAIVALSVRTGWDLLLAALELPAGSEVITSAVTIADMMRIVEQHGLVPVPVDVDAANLELDIEQVERLITPRTRAILVAHLFGSRVEMGPIIELARRHDLLVVEDCARHSSAASTRGIRSRILRCSVLDRSRRRQRSAARCCACATRR